MRAVDTNVLVRYFVNDDLIQAEAVERLFEECRNNSEPVFVAVPVVCELFWVLERIFRLTKLQLLDVFQGLLASDLFRFDRESVLRAGIEQYRAGRATLPDCLIGEISRQAGCRDTVSFDRDLRGAPGFTILR